MQGRVRLLAIPPGKAALEAKPEGRPALGHFPTASARGLELSSADSATCGTRLRPRAAPRPSPRARARLRHCPAGWIWFQPSHRPDMRNARALRRAVGRASGFRVSVRVPAVRSGRRPPAGTPRSVCERAGEREEAGALSFLSCPAPPRQVVRRPRAVAATLAPCSPGSPTPRQPWPA